MALDRLSPLDAGFLDVEDNVNQMHIGSVLIFQGPSPPLATFRAMVEGNLPAVPRYRQVMRRVAFEVGRPYGWTTRRSVSIITFVTPHFPCLVTWSSCAILWAI